MRLPARPEFGVDTHTCVQRRVKTSVYQGGGGRRRPVLERFECWARFECAGAVSVRALAFGPARAQLCEHPPTPHLRRHTKVPHPVPIPVHTGPPFQNGLVGPPFPNCLLCPARFHRSTTPTTTST
eukprot:77479-Chlamydomonas_euryale.AAC.1